ncbi:MAG TPA: threonine/serine dehydratase [Candidatus Baltobacteraceae bacterium]|nr:threonine/serine dehydratase [Candidatus Baltobacteraceae bacterium]
MTTEAIERTHELIASYVRKTPVIDVMGAALKLEFMQHAGSFKTRGAFANLLTRSIPPAGVVAASGGNHGAAVAYAAKTLGIPCAIFVPVVSSPAKIARIERYGAKLVVGGERYADAYEASLEYENATGALGVHAFDSEETLLGQATLGKEFEEQVPDLDTVLVAVGGGGLIGGVAMWMHGRKRVIAVEPEGAPTLHAAFEAGEPVDAPAGSIANDSLAPRRVGKLMFPIAREFVERVVLVTDDDIRAARAALWEEARIVAEPGGCAAFAAIVSGKFVPAPGERVGVVVSGANTVIDWHESAAP